MNYISALAAARTAARNANEALATARKHVEPPSAEIHALLMTRPAQYAECLRKMADIVETLPALAVATTAADITLGDLEERACYRCNGTGVYSGATNATRRGVPYCFYCDGHGEKRSK